jgi:hypothetical protein
MLRALDDLHTLAVSAGEVTATVRRLEERADRIEQMLGDALDVGRRIEDMGEGVLTLGRRIDKRAQAILALGERIDARAEGVLAMGERMEGVGREIMAEGRDIRAAASEVADRGAEVAAALPLLQRAVEMAGPLEGAVERLGRMVDRLPGGRGRAPRGGADDRPA